ncbi:MAG: matrixin family metalloprotease [Candidatus Gastranaerophilales bacterium]|nr:matrixin family metalloprotease [Candidatus Gastranaerophilales bacterium]
MDSQKNNEKKNEKNKSTWTITLIILAIALLLILGVYFYLQKLMPEHMFNQGKKYMEIGQYDKALKMFDIVVQKKPYDSEPVYYQALALSKLPPTYENQKKLYEISQLDDVEEASTLAENVLTEMRKQVDREAGSNYIDNVLYDDILIRWNNSKPVTYSIIGDSSVPQEYYDTIKEAINRWQTATNGQIVFKETQGNKNANIAINLIDDISRYDTNNTGKTIPEMDDNVLKKMNVYIRKTDNKGNYYGTDKLLTLAQHEIGHALGIGGHSANDDDIMYYDYDKISDDIGERNITDRDLNTINLLYRMVPDVIDEPISESEYNNMLYHAFVTTYPGENFELEIQKLISQLQNDRQNIVFWVDLAINYAYKKQYARSNYILHNILPLVKSDLQNQHVILYNLAANFYKMKDYRLSSTYLKLAENIQSDMDTQILDAFIDYREERIELAEDKLKILSEKYPENIDVALKLVEIYYKKKDSKKEMEIIDNLIKKNPKAIRDRRVLKYRAQKYKK